jgi:thymidylate synthase (FAD)
MQVKIISGTTDPINLLYISARQCYSPGSIVDCFDELMLISKNDKLKLINHVMSSGHLSVLEHASFTFAIKEISRACSHQLVRHRIASYSHQSQRYAGAGDEGVFTDRYVIPKTMYNPEITCSGKYFATLEKIEECYKEMVKEIPKEDARFILPNATKTNIIVTMNFRSLFHFFEERCCNCAQWEIRNMANTMLQLCKEKEPELFANSGAKCLRLGYCNESIKRSCGRRPTRDLIYKKVGENYVPLFIKKS